MGQFSVEIYALPGSLLSGNQQADLPQLRERALEALRVAVRTGTLLQSRKLMYNIYRWREFCADGANEVKDWLTEIMESDSGLVALAKALTGETWSTGMRFDGLGDRVSRRSVRAQVGKDFDLFDVEVFKGKLENLLERKAISQEALAIVQTFLGALAQSHRQDD